MIKEINIKIMMELKQIKILQNVLLYKKNYISIYYSFK